MTTTDFDTCQCKMVNNLSQMSGKANNISLYKTLTSFFCLSMIRMYLTLTLSFPRSPSCALTLSLATVAEERLCPRLCVQAVSTAHCIGTANEN